MEQATHGLVFVDEVDKIRSQVGGQPNVAGIRAQEALLTLIENESVPFTLPDWAGGATVNVDSSGLLFVCAGAFEGLYDAVYYRVTAGKDQGALRPVTVVDEAAARARSCSSRCATGSSRGPLRLRREPAVPLALRRRRAARGARRGGAGEDLPGGARLGPAPVAAYFSSPAAGSRSRNAARRIVRAAARQPRLGARALKEVFRRIVGPLEFDPHAAAGPKGVVRIDLERVKEALARDHRGGSASTTSGWDQSFSG